jgi:folate-binding protein YgfZ
MTPPTPSLTPASSAGALLRLEGADVLDLLHRISTQALGDLAPGAARATLFCDFRGRLLHRAVVARTGDGTVWLLRNDAAPDALAEHVDRHVFREDLRIMALPDAGVRLRFDAASLAAGTVAEEAGAPRRVQIAADVALEVVDRAAGGIHPGDEPERIARGWPRHGHEIRADFHPYEVGLASDVHLSKGCYTGQEVLLRLMTYQSVRRTLARLRGSGAVPAPPADVRAADREAGVLTSAAAVPGGWIGLAVLTKEALERGTGLSLAGATLEDAIAFPEGRPLGLT